MAPLPELQWPPVDGIRSFQIPETAPPPTADFSLHAWY